MHEAPGRAIVDWNGEGKDCSDIGCGAAALNGSLCQSFPKATESPQWTIGAAVKWNLPPKNSVIKMHTIERPYADRTSFQKGDAAKLDFPDENRS